MSNNRLIKRVIYLLGVSAVCTSTQIQAADYSEQRALEMLQFAPLNSPAFSTLGDGRRSFGFATTTPMFDAADLDRINPQYATDLSFSQRFSDATLHLSGTKSPLANSLGSGFSYRQTSLYVSAGDGSELAWSQTALPGFSDVYKSGFQSATNRWSDTSLEHLFSSGLQLRGGQTRINLDDRVDPSLSHAGLSWRGFSGDYAVTRRNGVTIGQGLSMNVQRGRFAMGYDEIRDINDHTLRAVRTTFANAGNRKIGFSLESGISPFTGVNDQRFMFSYSGQIRKPIRLSANDTTSNPAPRDGETGGQTGDSGQEEVVVQQKSYKKHLIIAGSIIGGAIALSSSSGNGDAQQGGFENQHQAARNVLNDVNPKSVRENREYGGWIIRSGDSTYGSTSPRVGNIDSVSLGAKPNNATATYHTHGSADPRYDNENFSPQDIRSDNIFDVDGYLATPSGAFLYYNHNNSNVSRLGTVAN